MRSHIKLLRPFQWSKNGLLFAPLIFSHKFIPPEGWSFLLSAFIGFITFSFISGLVYIINDIADREADSRHPEKCKRPIPSGEVKVQTAIVMAVVIGILSFTVSFLISPAFFVIAIAYFIINLTYSFYLKHVVLLDILLIALGFILRAWAGAVVVEVEPSDWFLLCTFFLALLLATGKRRYEYLVIKSKGARTRKVLEKYTEPLLSQITQIAASGAIISYSLYALMSMLPEYFALTIAFVVFGIIRYLYLVYSLGEGGNPDKLLFKDKPILLTVFSYAIVVMILFMINDLR